jgi:hypothetical protein
MIMTRYPKSLRQAVAYLECRPLVQVTAKHGTQPTSRWWFAGHVNGILWFDSYLRADEARLGRVGLELAHDQAETGLDFFSEGFNYIRGSIVIQVLYVDPLESLK